MCGLSGVFVCVCVCVSIVCVCVFVRRGRERIYSTSGSELILMRKLCLMCNSVLCHLLNLNFRRILLQGASQRLLINQHCGAHLNGKTAI